MRAAAAVALALGVLGFLVVVSGIVPIRASSGHWPLTRWFLDFAKTRSVSTHALGVPEPPELDDPERILRGAGHYDSGCQPCHGAPGVEPWRVTRELTPEPPLLANAVDEWKPEELFYIVKHGIKMTGMPAWPARERDDEVWAVVAFIRRLPGMTGAEYEALALGPLGSQESEGEAGHVAPAGDAPVPAAVREGCARCHGLRGEGRELGAFPKLAGQSEGYLLASLRAYATGSRKSGIMEPVASTLAPEVMAELAEAFSRASGDAAASAGREVVDTTEAPPGGAPAEGLPGGEPVALAGGSAERGRRIALDGVPHRKVPSCADCHGPLPRGQSVRNPDFPVLAGQFASYLALQLRLFAEGVRGGGPWAPLMDPVVHRLTAEQMADVAAYYASLAESAGSPATGPDS